MSILINGMEMPKNCGDCKAFVCYRQWAGDVGDCFCGITKNDAESKKKNADCPLVPVPPHGDLIERDALMDDIIGSMVFSGRNVPKESAIVQKVLDIVGDANAIITAEEGET